MKKCAVFFLATALVAPAVLSGAVIHVSAKGDDVRGNGSAWRPYATLARAVEAVKKRRGARASHEIVFADGVYHFVQPVTIDAQTPVSCIRAAHPGKVILSGAVPLGGWKRDPQNRNLLIADFPFEIDRNGSYALVVNGVKATLALYPAKEKKALPYFATAADIPLNNRTVLRYNANALPSKDLFKDLDLASVRVVVPQEWATRRPSIATNDWKNGIFHLKSRTDMPLGRFNQGYRILNSVHGMTAPGTWMYEGSTGKVRYWPRKGEQVKNLTASISRAARLFTVSKSVNLRLSGLVMEGCTVVPGAGMYSRKGPAAVIGGSRPKGLVVENCEIRNTSGSGILVTKPINAVVRGCKIHDIGATGVHYADGGDGGGVYDSEIYNIGGTGVYLQLPNVTLKGCRIHHVGRSAATIWTRNGKIVSNEFSHTMLSSRDGGAVYGAMNQSLFEGNYCHDCGNWPGLYNDEGGRETVYRGNKFINCWWPFHMHQTRDIVFTNNLLVCDAAMRFSFQGSANAVFRDNLIRTPHEITDDKYVSNCKVWENFVETGSSSKGWGARKVVRLEKKPLPLKSPCQAYPTKGALFPEGGKLTSSLFATPWKAVRWTDRDENGCHAPGIPGCWFSFGYDTEYLYIKANYEYNKFVYYPGCTTIGSGKWGEWDGLRFLFKGLEITVFIDGTVVSSDLSLQFDATNSSVRKYPGCGAGGYVAYLAIPLSSLGIKPAAFETLADRTINFDLVFYNAQYNETRYYEGPSKEGLPGVIRLRPHGPDGNN